MLMPGTFTAKLTADTASQEWPLQINGLFGSLTIE
jgi:hypothetical protein